MEEKVIDIEKANDFYQMNYMDLNFWSVLYQVFIYFFHDMANDQDYHPIFIYDIIGKFDPYRMNNSDSVQHFGNMKKAFQPWPEPNGLERTKMFLDEIYNLVTDSKYYTKIDNSKIKEIYNIRIIFRHFMHTLEKIGEDDYVVTMIQRSNKRIKRIHIRNLPRVCDLLRYGSENLEHDLRELVSDGSNIPIKDENVLEILNRFDFLKNNVYII